MIIVPSNVSAKKQLAFIGASASRDLGNPPAIPTHNAGDLIIIYLQHRANATPYKPAANATSGIPDWTLLAQFPGYYERVQIYYTVATGSNTTVGMFGNGHLIIANVVTGQNLASPFGASASYSNYGEPSLPAPAVTLQNATGSSLLIHMGGSENAGYFNSAFSVAGYTGQLVPYGSGYNYRVVTKNDTTSDGQMYLGALSGSPDYASVSMEILA